MTARRPAFAFPVFVDVRDRTVLVAGGGHEALAKARALAELGARVTSWAPHLAETTSLADVDGVRRVDGRFMARFLDHAILAIAGTGDRALDHRIAGVARRRGVLVNTIDDIPWCDWSAPAVLRRGDLTVAVGTGGIAPALAVRLRDLVAEELARPELADLLELFAEVRPAIMASGRPFAARRRLWYELVDGPALAHLRAGRLQAARGAIADAIAAWEAAA